MKCDEDSVALSILKKKKEVNTNPKHKELLDSGNKDS